MAPFGLPAYGDPQCPPRMAFTDTAEPSIRLFTFLCRQAPAFPKRPYSLGLRSSEAGVEIHALCKPSAGPCFSP